MLVMREKEAKIRQMVDICEQYYLKGKNQQDIADSLGLSRPSVSRLLTQARMEGIVTITVHNPYSDEQRYASLLEQRFGLHKVIVTNVPETDANAFALAQAEAATYLLDCELRNGDILGVMGGITLNKISSMIGKINRQNITVVPLIGGWGPSSAMWQANLNVRNFGERWNCQYYQLNAPAILSSATSKDALLKEPEIHTILSLGAQSNVALVGIGNVDETSSIFNAGLLTPNDLKHLHEMNIVASICNFFLNSEGEIVNFIDPSRTIGIETDQLRRVPHVIATANGTNKASAIAAALKGRWIDTLITDQETAQHVLALTE